MKYTVDHFINKFSVIPEHMIGTSQDTGCAYGQCRTPEFHDGSKSPEGKALESIMEVLVPMLSASSIAEYSPECGTPARINNGETQQYQQATPKQRILAALHDIKVLQQKEPAIA